MTNDIKNLGFGLGLRGKHIPYILRNMPNVDWFEIISENYMDTEGKALTNVLKIKELYPLVMHGVSLSIGTVDPLNSEYLNKLKKLANLIEPVWITDHLCWTGVAHKSTHDLLPIPYTEEALKHIIKRIKSVQDFLERPIGLENPSTYLEFNSSEISEEEFLATMVKESGCHLLLDLNNVYVSCYNHGYDPQKYIDALPLHKVIQIHLAGHSNKGTHIIDTHDGPVIDDVWDLYKYTVQKAERVPNTMIEWDQKIPEFPVLFEELEKAKAAVEQTSDVNLPEIILSPEKKKNYFQPLSKEQDIMQNAILGGQDHGTSPDMWIREKPMLTPQQQLDIYVDSYRYRLFDAVATDYPVLKNYLGKKAFEDVINDFISKHVSEHFNIARFSVKFPDFYAQVHPNDTIGQELAKFETAIFQISEYPKDEALSQSNFQQLSVDEFLTRKLLPRKALKLFMFSYAINHYYQAVKDGTNLVKPQKDESYVAVFRHNDIMWRIDLGKQEFGLLQKLFSNIDIGTALDSTEIEDETLISEWFSKWVSNGMLAA